MHFWYSCMLPAPICFRFVRGGTIETKRISKAERMLATNNLHASHFHKSLEAAVSP